MHYDNPSFQTTTLPNGLTIHAATVESRWQALYFVVHSGAAQDPLGFEGLAHFVEHTVSENIPRYATKDVGRFLKRIGDLSRLGQTCFLDTNYFYYSRATLEYLEKGIKIYGGMLIDSPLNQNIEREREVILGEICNYHNTPYSHRLALLSAQALYPEASPLHRYASGLGSKESVLRITPRDLQEFYKRHYCPKNISIIAIGKLALEELVKLFKDSSFGADNKPGERSPVETPLPIAPLPFITRCEIRMSDYFTSQPDSGFYICSTILPGTIQFEVMKILVEMLKDALSRAIREDKGWLYDVRVWHEGYGSLRRLDISCEELSWKAMAEIEVIIEKTILSLSQDKELFEDVQGCMIERSDIEEATIREICRNAAEDLIVQGRIITAQERKKNFKDLTLAEIGRALEELKPERRWTAISVP